MNNLCLPFQGAREEGPANLERANADAQVIHFNVLFALCQPCPKQMEKQVPLFVPLKLDRNLQMHAMQTLMTWR